MDPPEPCRGTNRFDRCMICQTETAEPLQEIDCNCDKSIPPYAAAESWYDYDHT